MPLLFIFKAKTRKEKKNCVKTIQIGREKPLQLNAAKCPRKLSHKKGRVKKLSV